MGIYFRDILLIQISKGAANCVQRVFEKEFFFHNYISPHFKLLLSNERLDFLNVLNKRSKGLAMPFKFHSLL